MNIIDINGNTILTGDLLWDTKYSVLGTVTLFDKNIGAIYMRDGDEYYAITFQYAAINSQIINPDAEPFYRMISNYE